MGPVFRTSRIGNEILPDFNERRIEAAGFAMHWHGVVALVVDGVGLVCGNHQSRFLQRRYEPVSKLYRAPEKYARVPGPDEAFEHRREAVNSEHNGCAASELAPIKMSTYGILNWPIEIRRASVTLFGR